MKIPVGTIKETILALATERGRTKTICPSEVARKLWPQHWRPHMEEVRVEAFQLRAEGRVRILQKGEEVNGIEIRGPIRIAIA